MRLIPLLVSCLCGFSRQTVVSRPCTAPLLLVSDLEEDRHGSGVLFVSYHPIEEPDKDELPRLSAYDNGENVTQFFCNKCGCHVFRKRSYNPASPAPLPLSTAATIGVTPALGSPKNLASQPLTPVGNEKPADSEEDCFDVATGTIVMSPEIDVKVEHLAPAWIDTIDGGLTPWLSIPKFDGRLQIQTRFHVEPSSDSVPAFCRCGNVQLKILRPQEVFSKEGAQYPYSPYPDLMYPFGRSPESTVKNPSQEAWYLSPDGTKYLAGTCACRSCRLITGYEIQTWAFIPRQAIQISVSSSPRTSFLSGKYRPPDPESYVPLDFEQLGRHSHNPLRSYESTPGTFREFCPCCGATVFWRGEMRPDLIDVSVGLLHAKEGARAESLLWWWRDRCSFSEDAGLDRTGWTKNWSENLIKGLEQGMKG